MNSQKGFAHLFLVLLLGVVAVGGVYYYLGTINANETNLTSTTPSPEPDNSIPSTWQRYYGPMGFSISYPGYPLEWEYMEAITGKGSVVDTVYFRPKIQKEDYSWLVRLHYIEGNQDEKVKELSGQNGIQFDNRQQKTEKVQTLAGEADMVTTTALLDSDERWVHRAVYWPTHYKGLTRLYEISDGATNLPEFITFYMSFDY